MEHILNQLYPNRLFAPQNINEIPQNGYMVYIMIYNGNPILVGHGKKNRSKIMFDNINDITSSHLKAFFVRLYTLFGNGHFERYIIACDTKAEARQVENHLHIEIGGNHRKLPIEIRNQLFEGIDTSSMTHLILEIALRSSFDGLYDLRKWRKDGILNDNIWAEISQKLQFNQ